VTDFDGVGRILFLSRADVVRAGGGSAGLYVEAVRRALTLHASGSTVQPLKPYLRWRPDCHVADRIIAMPAYLGGTEPAAGLKWIGSRHDNPQRFGLERASALVVLNDPETHHPIAVMEGALLSKMRTAAVTFVAARHLAPPAFTELTLVGCGPVGRAHVLGMLELFPSLSTIHLFDLRDEAARRLVDEAGGQDGTCRCVVHDNAVSAVRAGEVVVTCTVAGEPYLPLEWLRAGSFLANVSLRDVHDDVLLGADKLVVDDWDHSAREGTPLGRVVAAGCLSRAGLHAELGQIEVGERPGRESDDETIVLNPMGMAIFDVACAQAVFHRALEAGVGTWLAL
jgi:ornithine cyclodeaminase